jgi:ATP-dependent Clp protease ATP-binding subunit ClpA
VIRRELENRIARAVLAGEVEEGDRVRVDWDGKAFRLVPEKEGTEAVVE